METQRTEMTFEIWFAQFKATFWYLDKDMNSEKDLQDSSWDKIAIKKDYYDCGLSPLQAYDYFYNKAAAIKK